MENNKNIKSCSRSEIFEIFNSVFKNNFKEEDYSYLDWEKILKIRKNFCENIFNTNIPVEFYETSIANLMKINKTDLNNINSLSKKDVIKKFMIDFEKKYYPQNYSTDNWELIIQIRDAFLVEVENTSLYINLYHEYVNKLSNVEINKRKKIVKKNLYDLSSEELQIKFNDEFEEKYRSFSYTDEKWEEILSIYSTFNENINQTGFPLQLYSDSRYKLTQVEPIVKKETIGTKMASKIEDIAKFIGKVVSKTYNTVKFVFRIPLLNLSAVIITTFAHLILGTFIYSILPRFVNDFMFQSILSALLFVIFNVMLFLDQDDRDVLNNPAIQITKHCFTIPFYAAVFLIFTFLPEFPVLEEIFPMFYPQMWISAFTEEYVFSPMIALTINCLLSIAIYLFVRKKTEY